MSKSRKRPHPDKDIVNMMWLDDKIKESYKEIPKNMNDEQMIKWLEDVIDKTTPPGQLGVKPNFAPVTNAVILAHSRNQTKRKKPKSISLITPKITNFKKKLKLEGGRKKRKTRRLKNKRQKKRKRRRKSTKKDVKCKSDYFNLNNKL